MDGLDLEKVDELDQEAFEASFTDDEEVNIPLPDCIGIDSAVQDDEQVKVKQRENEQRKEKTRSEIERGLELKMLKPDSIRRQILEKSLNDGYNKVSDLDQNEQSSSKSHVMNIVEKAGMADIDKEKINGIIHEASKGSLFYKKQAQRQEEIHKSIEKMLNKVKMASPTQLANAQVTCDNMVEEIEKKRLFNKIIVHFDLDMFFAAVEIRDNPNLADKPVAVGGDSMVSTSNYIARKFGVRAAMPGFIAKKLCPNLILIKPNGSKYREASNDVFSVLEQYDPDLTSMSLDEAYLDLTEHVKNTLERDGFDYQEYYNGTLPEVWWTRANEVVEEIRDAIFVKTKLTCSAGIACNTLLAKIATDIKKPNGQYMVKGYPEEVKEFIRNTPVGKVSGIGKVSSQFLNALDIKTCGDIYEKRQYLPIVFYEINVKFYLKVSMGDGSTCIKSDEQRKSKSVERTFAPIKDTLKLLDKLDSICEELCTKYLKPYRIRGRTVTVKLKRNTFTTTTKSYSLLVPTNDKLVVYSSAKNLLLSEIASEPAHISYRLLGVRLSNLADDSINTNQLTIDAMLRNQEMVNSDSSESEVTELGGSVKRKTPDSERIEDQSSEPKHIKQSTTDDLNKLTTIREANSNQSTRRKSARQMKLTELSKTCPMPFRSASTQQATSSNYSLNNFSSQVSGSQKVSFYQKFVDLNSQSFSQKPKFEPLQCPFCMHGFVCFEILEGHARNCLKRRTNS